MALTTLAISLAERSLLPSRWIRYGIQELLRERIRSFSSLQGETCGSQTATFVDRLKHLPVAIETARANEQHYELPVQFFGLILGPHRKYSSGWWPDGTDSLIEAEEAALTATCERAELKDGQQILELGCGWGSLTLWMAERFPRGRIQAISNSRSQRAYIQAEATRRHLTNLEVVRADINTFELPRGCDRIISVEMFEHVRNWPTLFRRVANALAADGRFFMHVFAHRAVPYFFEVEDPGDWMSRYFFSGGMMPSEDLVGAVQGDLELMRQWRWDGTHYQRTAAAWLANLDAHRDQAMRILAGVYGQGNERLWLQRWRLFFMACEELFGFRHGQEWGVSHYLLKRSGG